MEYDKSEASRYFLKVAENAERDLKELGQKCERNRVYERDFDDRLATFYVYNYLHGRTFLDTREQLVTALRELALETSTPSEAKDPETFEKFRQFYIGELIGRYADNAEGA